VERANGYEVRRLAIRSRYSAGSRQILYLPRFWRRAWKELGSLKPDIIHCHDLDTAPVGYLYARRRGIPWIFDAHECYPEQIGPQVNRAIHYLLVALEKQMTRRASHTITVGDLLAQRLRSLGGQVSVVGNYQSLDAYNLRSELRRAELDLKPDDYVVAYIGGFSKARAILPLIHATKHLDNATILLAGDGPQRSAIEAEVVKHPNTRYLGWIPSQQVPAYTKLADVIYYGLSDTSGNNRFSSPNALFSALAAGRPIVTTDIGEIAHIVRQEECGIVVSRPTAELVAQAIERLRNPTTRAALADRARHAAEAKYNWRAAEKVLLDVYRYLGSAY
jgi:glycosyltransferase involved in cell wall biosynthesis